MSQVFELTGKGLVLMTSQGLQVGQRVIQAHRGERGVICEDRGHEYLVIFPDGSEAGKPATRGGFALHADSIS